MKITRISVFAVELPTKGGAYRRPWGLSPAAYDSTIVKIETDAGVFGLGEVCPIGTHYMRGWAGAVRSGVPLIAKALIGEDPFQVERLNRAWDARFRDDQYVKAPLDMALWDIIGRASDRPVSEMLGGRYAEAAPLYRSVHVFDENGFSPDAISERCRHYRAEGYRHFQLKVGGEPDEDIAMIAAASSELRAGERVIADANSGWTMSSAIRVAQAVRDLPVVIEQPCRTLEECIAVRPHCGGPVKLDESMETIQDVLRAFHAGAVDIVCIKVGRVGGLTKARRMRDLCLDLGLTVCADDVWGSEIVSSSLAHFAQSTDPKHLINTTDLTDYVTVRTADGFPGRDGGEMTASTAPGLGLNLRLDALGAPIAVVD